MSFSAEFLYKIVDKMTPVMKRFRKENEAFAKQMRRNTSIANQMQSKLVNLGKAGERALNKINTAGKQNFTMFDKLKRKAKEAKQDIASTFQVAGAGLKKAADKTRIASLIATASIIGMVAAHSRFEKGFTDVLNLNATEEYSKIGKQIKQTTKQAIGLGFSIRDSNAAMFDAVSGSGANQRALSSYSEALILARAGNSELKPALSAITSAMETYELSADKAKEISMDLFLAQRIGRTDVEQMSNSIGRFLPIAKMMGLSFREAAVSSAIFTKGGLDTAESMTSIRGLFAQLSVVQGKSAKTLERLKIPFKTTEVRAAGLANVFEKLIKAQKEHPNLIRQALPNIRAFTGAMGLTDEKMKLMKDTLKEASEQTKENSVVMKAYGKVQETVAANTSKAKGSITLLAITLGEKLKPLVLSVMKGLVVMADWLTSSPKWFQIATLAVIGFIAVLSPLLAMAGSIATAIGFIGVPVAILIAKIAAIIALVVTWTTILWKNWEVLNAWFDQFGILGKIIKWIVGGPIYWLIAAAKGIMNNWSAISGFFSNLWAGVAESFGSVMDLIQSGLKFLGVSLNSEYKSFLKIKEDLEKGKKKNEELEKERNKTESGFKAQSQPEQRVRLDGQININDKSGMVEDAESTLMGMGNAGLAFGGL